jgi:ribonuclease P protein component
MRYVAGAEPAPPRVAIATPRATGTAVARNRVRRRLRAAVAAHEHALAPGGAYLFGAGREAVGAPFDTLETTVGELLATVRHES